MDTNIKLRYPFYDRSLLTFFFVSLVGLVFPAIAMPSLFLHVQKNKIV